MSWRNRQAEGEIDVRIVGRTMPDGSVQRNYIVDIPGTRSWQVNPVGERDYLNDLGTNLHALAGDTRAYQRGVEQALREAGAKPGDPVMLVGHSQGGMVAMRAANDFVVDRSFNVTHVVTAGSPVSDMSVPDSVQVLSVENEHDIVPHLDGRENPDAPNRTTVSFDQQLGEIRRNHSIAESYLGAAEQLDGSADPSVQAFRDSANAFLEGESVESKAYRLTRTELEK